MKIRNRYTNEVIFESDHETMVETVTYAVSQRASLRKAKLEEASLRKAKLEEANLFRADLRKANLREANLREANLREANLREANLEEANLFRADLRKANLRGANLRGAKLTDAQYNYLTTGMNLSCPEEGSFTAFKIASGKLVKLLIPEDAKRSSATTRKCRCDRAFVVAVEGEEPVRSAHDFNFYYREGDLLRVYDFDEDRWNECSTGIHFFMTKKEALEW